MCCEQGFLSFQVWLFWEYNECDSGDRGCGWCDGVGVV